MARDEEVHTCEMLNCESTETSYVIDPFLEQVNEVIRWVWLCEECLETRRMDI